MAETASRRFETAWRQFSYLPATHDLLAREREHPSRRATRPFISFIVPVDDPAARAQLVSWQHALRDSLHYAPQPENRLHITLHEVTGLHGDPRLRVRDNWQRASLEPLAARVRQTIEGLPSFTVHIGPLNAFSATLFAEVQDPRHCLRLLRASLRHALPPHARPPAPWQFLPHITLGYWGEQPVSPLVAALTPFRSVTPVPVCVRRVLFTIYARGAIPLDGEILREANEEVLAEYNLKD